MKIGIKTKLKISNEYGFLPATDDFFDMSIAESKGYYKVVVLRLEAYNVDIGKTRKKGPYVKSHLINVRNQLLNCPVIKVIEKLGTWSYRVKIIPFDDVQKLEKTDTILNADDVVVKGENQERETDTEIQAEDAGLDLQQLIYADQKTKAAGVVFQKEDLWKIAKHPKELIDRAISCFKAAELSQSTFIRNPAGWLISCPEKKYYLSYRPEKILKSLEQRLFDIQDQIIDLTGSLPSRPTQSNIFSQKKIGLSP